MKMLLIAAGALAVAGVAQAQSGPGATPGGPPGHVEEPQAGPPGHVETPQTPPGHTEAPQTPPGHTEAPQQPAPSTTTPGR